MPFSSSYGFPTSTPSPKGFGLFTFNSNPRDNYRVCSELGQILGSSSNAASTTSKAARVVRKKGSVSSYASYGSASSAKSKSSTKFFKTWFSFD